MDKTDAAVAKIIEALNAAVSQHGAAGMDIAVHAIQVQAVMRLIVLAVVLLVAVLCYRTALRRIPAYFEQIDDKDAGIAAKVVTGIAGGFVLFFTTVICLAEGLGSPLVWASAIDGRLGLAMRILDKVL